MPGLCSAAAEATAGRPVWLDREKALRVAAQFRQTADHRGWLLTAGAVMANHFHLVVCVPGDPDPRKVLADFKAYASRALNAAYGRPTAGRWWTTNGSKRKLADAADVTAATRYVLHKQPRPLVTWSADDPGESDTASPSSGRRRVRRRV